MRNYVFIVAAAAALLVLAGVTWVVRALRRPFVRETARRDRIDSMIARYQPPAELLRRGPSPATDAARRQFTTWG
jgi:hypothetical protein